MHFQQYIKRHLAAFPCKDVTWNYEDGCVLTGSIMMYQATKDEYYRQFVIDYMSEFICADGTIRTYHSEEYNLDNINSGKALFFLYQETGEEKYRTAIEILRQQLKTQPRTKCGNFWHKNIYPWQIWLDGLYMAQPFLTAYERDFGDKDNYKDIINQFANVHRLLRNPESGLYYHGYDEAKTMIWADKETGLSANYWLRAMGWYLIALIDTLDEMKDSAAEGAYVLSENFREAIDSIMEYQDRTSKLFYQVIDKSEEEGNYLETSGSAMVAYALLKGSLMGVLEPDKYACIGEEILLELHNQKLVEKDGTFELIDICQVAGLGPKDTRDGSISYYLSEPVVKDDHKGSGAFIMAYAQLLELQIANGESIR